MGKGGDGTSPTSPAPWPSLRRNSDAVPGLNTTSSAMTAWSYAEANRPSHARSKGTGRTNTSSLMMDAVMPTPRGVL
eukprot:461226-Amphidinium_carterae.1